MADANFVQGPLEDGVRGALRFNGKKPYAVLPHASLAGTPPQAKAPKIENRPHAKIT